MRELTEVYEEAEQALRPLRKQDKYDKIVSRYFECKNLSQVGREFGLSRERIRQIVEAEEPGLSSDVVQARILTRQIAKLERQTRLKSVDATGKTTPEYRCYVKMLERCYNPENPLYPSYGGRGITVRRDWRARRKLAGFKRFYAHMGKRPSDKHPSGRAVYSIHRPHDCNYGHRCYWATQREQALDRRPRAKRLKSSPKTA